MENTTTIKLEATLNQNIMQFDPAQPIEANPVKDLGLNSLYINMRSEIYGLGGVLLRERKDKLKKLYIQDFLDEQRELTKVDLGFIHTQP